MGGACGLPERARAAPPSAALMAEETQEFPTSLLTIQSLSELQKQSEPNGEAPASTPSKLKYSKTLSELDGLALKNDPHTQSNAIWAALSHRSSKASMKVFFSPMSIEPVCIQRVSVQSRVAIDQGLSLDLQDVHQVRIRDYDSYGGSNYRALMYVNAVK